MGWTTPTARVTGESITQAIWNTDLVDNLLYLYSTLITFLIGRTRTTVSVAAGSASVDIQNIDQSGADLIISGVLHPATDDVGLFLRLNNKSGGTDYYWQASISDPGASGGDSKISLNTGITGGNGVGNGVAESIQFVITIPAYTDVTGSVLKNLIFLHYILSNHQK